MDHKRNVHSAIHAAPASLRPVRPPRVLLVKQPLSPHPNHPLERLSSYHPRSSSATQEPPAAGCRALKWPSWVAVQEREPCPEPSRWGHRNRNRNRDRDRDRDRRASHNVALGHEKLDVCRPSIGSVAPVHETAQAFDGIHRAARDQRLRSTRPFGRKRTSGSRGAGGRGRAPRQRRAMHLTDDRNPDRHRYRPPSVSTSGAIEETWPTTICT